MRAREWKASIEEERDRLNAAAEAERAHGEQAKLNAYAKAASYEQTARSLQNILDRAAKDKAEDDENGDEEHTTPEPPPPPAEKPKRKRGRPKKNPDPETPVTPAVETPPRNELAGTVGEGAKSF